MKKYYNRQKTLWGKRCGSIDSVDNVNSPLTIRRMHWKAHRQRRGGKMVSYFDMLPPVSLSLSTYVDATGKDSSTAHWTGAL